MIKKSISMQIVLPHAGGIDIGSKSHFVAKGQCNDQVEEGCKLFSCIKYNE